MTRALWYHWAGASLLSVLTSLLFTGRETLEENFLHHLFADAGHYPAIAGILITIGLLLSVARLCMRVAGVHSHLAYLTLYALALYTHFIFPSSRYPSAALSVLLLVLSLLNLLDRDPGVKRALAAGVALLAASILSRSMMVIFPVFIAFLILRKRAAPMLTFGAAFLLPYFILKFSGVPGLAQGLQIQPAGISLENPLASTFSWIGRLRTSPELHPLMGYAPFLLASIAALTVRDIVRDRSALSIVLVLSLFLLLHLPAAAHDVEGARAIFLASCVMLLTAAGCGAVFLNGFVPGKRLVAWKLIVGGLFLLPPIVSFI